jgi:ERCC4-type nuclease
VIQLAQGQIGLAGIEYKTIPDFLTSSTDGRLTGTQLPRMLGAYTRLYLLLEGPIRVTCDGLLELQEFNPRSRQYEWCPARGRKGEGWTYREFAGRLESIAEFFGCRIWHTHNIKESAQWITALYHYWQRPYESHSSYRQWDQSGDGAARGQSIQVHNLMQPTSDLPLVQRWARELPGIGQDKSAHVARYFGTPLMLAMSEVGDWERIKWEERLKTRAGFRRRGFSRATAAKIVQMIREGHESRKTS